MKHLSILIIGLLSVTACANTHLHPDAHLFKESAQGSLTVDPNKEPSSFVFQRSLNQTVFTIKQDGNIEFGPGVKLDEASKAFWEAVRKNYLPCKCEEKKK